MPATDHICEVCGHEDDKGGVASLTLGPMSIYFCRMCITFRAEPKFAFEAVFGPVPSADAGEGVYYEPADDCYHYAHTGEVCGATVEGLHLATYTDIRAAAEALEAS